MEFELRIVVEKVAVSTQDVVQRDTLKTYDVKAPDSLIDLGLRHSEQISLLEKVQNSVLAEQSKLVEQDRKHCPNCGLKLSRNGYHTSSFHAVFSDHKVRIQKHRCLNPECRWQSTPTVKSVFGNDRHPDLAKLQCEQGARFSYRVAQQNLEQLNTRARSVNNHTQISRLTDQVGALLAERHGQTPLPQHCAAPARTLIVQVDGGHLPTQVKGQRSFEALAALVYRPENLQTVAPERQAIVAKSCAISAQDDQLVTLKTYLLNAAKKQGLTAQSGITALADGANNCWSAINSLQSHCQKLEAILDWFHIGMKFQRVKHALGETLSEALERCKWKLWQGQVEATFTRLQRLIEQAPDEQKRSKLQGLHDYLHRNRSYLVDYKTRKDTQQVFTSQVAESHIESLINERQKHNGKMQWTRTGAHNVLQIRASMCSDEWSQQWQGIVLEALGAAA